MILSNLSVIFTISKSQKVAKAEIAVIAGDTTCVGRKLPKPLYFGVVFHNRPLKKGCIFKNKWYKLIFLPVSAKRYP